MVDKRRERLYVEHLRDVYPNFPAGELDGDGERPDILVRASDGRVVGIEVTVFHLPPEQGERPHQATQSLKNRVVQLAWVDHTNRGGPPLYVRVFFNRPSELTGRNVHGIATQLAAAIGRVQFPAGFGEPGIRLDRDQLPPSVGDVSIDAAIKTPLWTADGGGWVAPVLPHHVETVLERKADMLSEARSKCDEVWLAIVCNDFGKAAQAEITDEARSHRYAHSFDRVIWFDLIGGAYELVRQEADA